MRVLNRPVSVVALTVSAAVFAATTGTAAADDGTTTAAADQAPATSQPFLAWGDTSTYELAPDGDFAQGLDGWSTTGQAAVVAGGDPWSLTGSPADQALDLPPGSSATSPTTSIDVSDPSIRFFAANDGDPGSLLSVSVTITTVLGLQVSLPIGIVSGGSDWQPSPTMWIVVNLLAGDGTVPAQFTFTPIGAGDWQIDDLYVDPRGRT
jgi:hypothetical protein